MFSLTLRDGMPKQIVWAMKPAELLEGPEQRRPRRVLRAGPHWEFALLPNILAPEPFDSEREERLAFSEMRLDGVQEMRRETMEERRRFPAFLRTWVFHPEA